MNNSINLLRNFKIVNLQRSIHTSECFQQIQKETRLRVVDNSKIGREAMSEGKPPYCIQVYSKKKYGYLGKSFIYCIYQQ